MIVLGLTGSIGMGKTTVARLFRQGGVAVHEADSVVRDLLKNDRQVTSAIRQSFPDLDWPDRNEQSVDRAILAAHVFADRPALARSALARLESILHPLVADSQRHFLQVMARRRIKMVVLEAPLLFEVGAVTKLDAIIVVTAPSFIQERRVLARAGMDRQRFATIITRQLSDCVKRRQADFVIRTTKSLHHTRMEVLRIRDQLGRGRLGRADRGRTVWIRARQHSRQHS